MFFIGVTVYGGIFAIDFLVKVMVIWYIAQMKGEASWAASKQGKRVDCEERVMAKTCLF